jgi:hypothetical protein
MPSRFFCGFLSVEFVVEIIVIIPSLCDCISLSRCFDLSNDDSPTVSVVMIIDEISALDGIHHGPIPLPRVTHRVADIGAATIVIKRQDRKGLKLAVFSENVSADLGHMRSSALRFTQPNLRDLHIPRHTWLRPVDICSTVNFRNLIIVGLNDASRITRGLSVDRQAYPEVSDRRIRRAAH